MPCEHYKDALTETAVIGAEPQGEFRAHLAVCAPCRAAFAAEQSLFYSIDIGLHANANADVPATLLPRVRARLSEESSPDRSWGSVRLVLAVAATMAIVFLMTQLHWRSGTVHQPTNTAANREPLRPAIAPPQKQNVISGLT
ncbi:MAG: hypothetical protein ACRD36_01565, partial [Candidatus Acidiferrum sp.]